MTEEKWIRRRMKTDMNRMSTLWRHLTCVFYGRKPDLTSLVPRKKAHESPCANLQFVNPGLHPMRRQSERNHEIENERGGGGEKTREVDAWRQDPCLAWCKMTVTTNPHIFERLTSSCQPHTLDGLFCLHSALTSISWVE